MEKYLGNKRVLLNDIFDFVKENCPKTKSICDIFSGTTNVGRFFQNKGYTVFSNDINRFSYILGRCYFGLKNYPQFTNIHLPKDVAFDSNSAKDFLEKALRKDGNIILNGFNQKEFLKENSSFLKIISYLNNILKYRKPEKKFIKEHFTIYGSKSGYISVRGTVGKRNYFSRENAEKLDMILEQIREWYLLGLLNDDKVCALLTAVIEEVVLVANVNGTFHDFNRERLWPNSLQKFSLKIPLYELSEKNHFLCDDASKAIKMVPQHDILYIDPPYNFRQYTAYYHFLNFISAYPFLESVEDYLENIEFVRGQNMNDDFTSDFCFQDKFVQAIKELISTSKSKFVVISYYGGRNHWNHWSKEELPNDNGFKQIISIFEDTKLFKNYKAESVFQKRQNYQSRVGEKKEVIDEYLFFGERKRINQVKPKSIMECSKIDELSIPNKLLNLTFFKPTFTSATMISERD